MELQPPQSPRTVQVSQEPTKPKLDPDYYAAQQAVSDTIEQLRQQRKIESSNALNTALSNHREEILEALNQRIDERCNQLKSDIVLLQDRLKIQQDYNTQIAERIRKLSQNSEFSGATFLKYAAITGFLALLIGVTASSAKIIAMINHVINQSIKT